MYVIIVIIVILSCIIAISEFPLLHSSKRYTAYKKDLLFISKSPAVLGVPVAIFSNYVIKTKPSDVELHKDLDSYEQKIVQETMAELRAIFCLGIAKKQAEEGNFPCKLR